MSLLKLKRSMTNPLLVTPLHEAYLTRTGDVELSPSTIAYVAGELAKTQRIRTDSFSASSSGVCQRRQVYDYIGGPKDRSFSSDINAIFIHGTWTHLKWQAMGLEAGWLAEPEVSVELPEYGLKGTLDGILTSGDGWELKSINKRGFKDVLTNGPKHAHGLQTHAYMLATGLTRWSVVYEEKDTQQWKEFVLVRDEKIIEEVKNELAQMMALVEVRRLPVIRADCLQRTGTAFRQCPYRDSCLESDRWPKPVLTIRRSKLVS